MGATTAPEERVCNMSTAGWLSRFSTKKGIVKAVAVTATALVCAGAGLQAATASDEDVDNLVCTSWEPTGVTDWSTDPNPPGEDTDTLRYVDQETQGENADAYWEYYVVEGEPSLDIADASWVTESPGEGWVVVDTDTVVVPGVDQWWHWTGGPEGPQGTPPPAEGWKTDNGNHNGLPDDVNVIIQTDKHGKSNWFYHQVVEEQSYDVYKYGHEVPATQQEYRWVIESRTCDTTEVDDNTQVKHEVATKTKSSTPMKEKSERPVPLSVDAGL